MGVAPGLSAGGGRELSGSPESDPAALVEGVFRDESSRAVASLIRVLGDFDLAEEAVQDAFVAALEHWPRAGVPRNPGAWITATARNRAIDRLRRARRLSEKITLLERDALAAAQRPDAAGLDVSDPIPDDRLRLIFTCCHPALNPEARVALTLRAVGGLSTTEIARAFLVPEATLAQRLVRAKRKIRDAGIPYRVPPDHLLPERLESVLAVLYLIYNEAYSTTDAATLSRPDLGDEAIRLTRLLVTLMPDEPEAAGLLALMLLHESRRGARLDANGEIVLLADQDRTRWDRSRIEEGRQLLERALRARRPGTYQLQAAIAALHATAGQPEHTDWRQIASLYERLGREAPSPVVELNRAVAVAMAEGPEAGLRLLDRPELSVPLERYHLFHAARADLLRRLARRSEAVEAYRHALALATNQADRRFLRRRLAEVEAATLA